MYANTKISVKSREQSCVSLQKRDRKLARGWNAKEKENWKENKRFFNKGAQGQRHCLEKSNISKIGGGRKTKKERERLGKRKKEWKGRSTRKSKEEIQTDRKKKKKTERA